MLKRAGLCYRDVIEVMLCRLCYEICLGELYRQWCSLIALHLCKCKSFSEPLTVLASLFIMRSWVCPSSNSNAQTFLPDPERKTTVAKLQKMN